jgi:thiamine kinase-like enzyme
MPKSPRKDCPPGKIRNEKTGRCIKDIRNKKDCPPGKIRNEKTGRCIKDVNDGNIRNIRNKKECPPGKIRNEKTGRCINDPAKKKKSKKSSRKASENAKPVVQVPVLNVKPGPFDAALRCQPGDKRCSLADIVNDENIAKYIFYNNEKQCAYYKKGDQMGQPSLFGSIYYTCCDEENKPPKNCNHITKIVKFNSRREYLNFYDEITAHQIAAKARLAPAIVKVYLTEKQGIIIMQKMKETLWELMRRNIGLFVTLKIPEERVREIASGWATEVGKLIVELHHLGMLHNDTHANNFMLDDKGKLYMIDFGRTNTRHYKEVTKRGGKFVELCDVHHDKRHYSTEKCDGLLEYEYRQIEWAQDSRNKYHPSDPRYWAFDAYAKRLIEIKNIEIGLFRDGKLVL